LSATTLLVVGATGLVGRAVVELALADARVARVVAPTRRPLGLADPRVDNPVVDFDALPADAPWWTVDAVVGAIGSTSRKAGSDDAYRRIDMGYTLAVARHTLARGARAFALTSSVGANPRSRFFYMRMKGEIEDAIAALGFVSFTAVRPAILIGARGESRPLERVSLATMRGLSFLLPRRQRPVRAEDVARALLFAALTATPGRHVVESEAIARA